MITTIKQKDGQIIKVDSNDADYHDFIDCGTVSVSHSHATKLDKIVIGVVSVAMILFVGSALLLYGRAVGAISF